MIHGQPASVPTSTLTPVLLTMRMKFLDLFSQHASSSASAIGLVVDAAVIVVLVAGEAVSFIAVTAGVERIVLADEPAAVGTGGVVIVVAIPAEGRIICTVVVVPPDAVTAPGAGGGQLSKAVRAEQFTVECCEG